MSQRSKTPTPIPASETPRDTQLPRAVRALHCWTVLALFAAPLHAGTPSSLTTTFVSNNGSSGNMFDISVTSHCRITDFDCNFSTGTVAYEIYTIPGTYIGNENNPGAWTLVASGSVVSNGIDVPTPLGAGLDIIIPHGESLGFYVAVSNGVTVKYTNGLGTGIAASNDDMTITEGIGISYPFGTAFNPRVWNGTVHYDADTGQSFCFGYGESSWMCPCGNNGAPERGCANSVGFGARLVGSGGASLATDGLRFDVDGMPAHRPGLLVAGSLNINGGAGVYFGDGLSCVGGTLTSLGVHYSDSAGYVGWGQNLITQGGFAVGSTQYFQVIYRESGIPCGSGFNTSNGVAVTIVP